MDLYNTERREAIDCDNKNLRQFNKEIKETEKKNLHKDIDKITKKFIESNGYDNSIYEVLLITFVNRLKKEL